MPGPHTLDAPIRAELLAPRELRLAPVPPSRPAAGWLEIAPDAVGVCGTDLELYDGTMPYLTNGFSHYPLVPGHEWTGLVTAVGDGTQGFAIGDRVVGECSIGCGSCDRCASGDYHLCPRRAETGIAGQPGGLQQRLLFPAASAHRLKPTVAPADAAMVEPLAIAYRALLRTGAEAGDHVVVIGAGTIGLFCALVGQSLGMRVELVEIAPDRAGFATSLGLELAPHERADAPFVIEASGSAGGRRDAVRRCAAGGTVVLVGFSGAIGELDLDDVVVRDVTLRGSLGSPAVWPEVIRLIERGVVRPSVVVSHEFDLEHAEEAFRLAAMHGAGVRKILVRPNR